MKRMSSSSVTSAAIHNQKTAKPSMPLKRVVGYDDDEDDEIRDARQEIAKANFSTSPSTATEGEGKKLGSADAMVVDV